ncbi:Alpha/Beta hydrolase protein [Irpex rosettiformis]|uniref:Alpha/Beta hydrolase protein n=1 Tax=Irpex rosettiformis TaxID=378272 RepID=A0ACB8U212_9APHY|nr:Alpha/Beta hydrolase protein [Irpex rosettiformis]
MYQLLTNILLFTGILSLSSGAISGSIVDLGYAKYRGNVSFPNTVAFLGLPFAEPPVGQRRWRAPLPLDTARISRQARGTVVDATSYPEFCVQGTTGNGDAGGAGSEDCLKLNIYAPLSAKSGDKLPVLFYIHGGGYVYGNPANWPFNHWIHQFPDVVVVSIYYRLDSLGFLAHPAFVDNPELGDLNVGFLDQVEAMKWVQKHISAFGGDPTQITINGQSAGGSSVELHLVSPKSEGLFARAIAQSVFRAPLPSPEQQEPLFNFYAQKAGCGSGPVSTQMACLRNASLSALAPAQDSPFSGPYNGYHPALDSKTIPVSPTISVLSGNKRRVPLIVGATSNETLSGGTNLTAALKASFPGLTNDDLQEFAEHYPLSDFDSIEQQVEVGAGESQLRCAAEILGGAFSKQAKSYVYRYNTANPTSGNTAVVGHAAENWMMFLGTNTGFNGSTTFSSMTPSEDAFASELIAYWLSFVRSGDPNKFKLARAPTWPTYSPTSAQRIVLTEGTVNVSGSTVETIPELEQSRCAFVATKAHSQQN